MERIPLVRTLDNIDLTNTSAPGIRPEIVVGELRVSEELAAQISARARAGLGIKLEFLAQERENGFFLIAGSLGSIPVAVNKVAQPESMVTINGGQTEPEAVVLLPDATILDPGRGSAPPQGDKLTEETPAK